MYKWVEHTSELELTIEDDALEGVFVEALVALGDLLTEKRGGEPLEHRIEVDADDLPALLVRWLEELVYLAEVDGFVPERAVEIAVDPEAGTAKALVFGQRLEPQTVVKAVTYHRLELARTEHGWEARVVLDV